MSEVSFRDGGRKCCRTPQRQHTGRRLRSKSSVFSCVTIPTGDIKTLTLQKRVCACPRIRGQQQCGDSRKLPDIGVFSDVHFEGIRRRPKPFFTEGVDILSDEFVAEPGDDLLARRSAARQRGAQRHNSQNTHFADSPDRRHTTATCGRGQEGQQQISIYFGITGGRDYRVIAPHFNETHVDQDSEVTRTNRYYVGAPALCRAISSEGGPRL